MGIPMLHTLLVTGVFGLCALEFILGVFLVFGCYRRSCPLVTLLFMCVMLPLTAWIAIENPVSDCGCFGDFLVISNWATFWKNVVLTAMTVWLVKFNRRYISLISPAFQWMAVVITLCFIMTVCLVGYTCQPLLDFRPYLTGTALVNEDEGDSAESGFVFVYAKDGQTKEFNEEDELPDEEDGWTFVERKEIKSEETIESAAQAKTLRVWSRDGETDVTEDVIDGEGKMLVLMIPYLPAVSPATTWKINAMYDWATDHDTEMIAVVSGNETEIVNWQNMSMPEYEIYTSDDTAIKEVARGNPAVVYLDNGVIEWKSTLSALDIDDLTPHSKKITPPEVITESRNLMLNLFYLYLVCMAVPFTLSFIPRIKDAYARRKDDNSENEAENEAETETGKGDASSDTENENSDKKEESSETKAESGKENAEESSHEDVNHS